MAYYTRTNQAVTILHPVRDPAGALVSGEAANITTALLDETATSHAATVTVTEIGTTGWYNVAFTPDANGNWSLQVTNPAGTDLSTTEYTVQVVAGTGPVTTDLTTLARCKTRMGLSGTGDDDLIGDLVDEVSTMLVHIRGYNVVEAEYTEYVDGHNTNLLLLREGPLVSITSVESVEYEDDGASGVTETATTVDEINWLGRGWRSESWRGRAWLERRGAAKWAPGERNYKVVYSAGHSTVPPDLVNLATRIVVAEYKQRESWGFSAMSRGDQNWNPVNPEVWHNAILRTLARHAEYTLA